MREIEQTEGGSDTAGLEANADIDAISRVLRHPGKMLAKEQLGAGEQLVTVEAAAESEVQLQRELLAGQPCDEIPDQILTRDDIPAWLALQSTKPVGATDRDSRHRQAS